VSRPTPDRPDSDADEDEDIISRLVSEAGDPQVEPRPEHVADLRALILDRLGPLRTDRPSRTRWLAVAGLAAACLVAVFAWPRGDSNNAVPGFSGRPSSDPITPRAREDPTGVAAWGNVRRGLNLSEVPAFSWPLQESARLSRLTSIPPDLLD
jgi:hypothetical protein